MGMDTVVETRTLEAMRPSDSGARCMAHALLAALLVPTVAQAQYLDPGASSIIVQSVVAGVVAIAAIVKVFWWRISGFFSKDKSRKNG